MSASAPVLCYLSTLDGSLVYELEDAETEIGRADGNDIVLKNSRSISGKHAKLVVRPDGSRARLYDLKTLNGTFVNDTRVQNSYADLHSGDAIRLGYDTTIYRFYLAKDAPADLLSGSKGAAAAPRNASPAALRSGSVGTAAAAAAARPAGKPTPPRGPWSSRSPIVGDDSVRDDAAARNHRRSGSRGGFGSGHDGDASGFETGGGRGAAAAAAAAAGGGELQPAGVRSGHRSRQRVVEEGDGFEMGSGGDAHWSGGGGRGAGGGRRRSGGDYGDSGGQWDSASPELAREAAMARREHAAREASSGGVSAALHMGSLALPSDDDGLEERSRPRSRSSSRAPAWTMPSAGLRSASVPRSPSVASPVAPLQPRRRALSSGHTPTRSPLPFSPPRRSYSPPPASDVPSPPSRRPSRAELGDGNRRLNSALPQRSERASSAFGQSAGSWGVDSSSVAFPSASGGGVRRDALSPGSPEFDEALAHSKRLEADAAAFAAGGVGGALRGGRVQPRMRGRQDEEEGANNDDGGVWRGGEEGGAGRRNSRYQGAVQGRAGGEVEGGGDGMTGGPDSLASGGSEAEEAEEKEVEKQREWQGSGRASGRVSAVGWREDGGGGGRGGGGGATTSSDAAPTVTTPRRASTASVSFSPSRRSSSGGGVGGGDLRVSGPVHISLHGNGAASASLIATDAAGQPLSLGGEGGGLPPRTPSSRPGSASKEGHGAQSGSQPFLTITAIGPVTVNHAPVAAATPPRELTPLPLTTEVSAEATHSGGVAPAAAAAAPSSLGSPQAGAAFTISQSPLNVPSSRMALSPSLRPAPILTDDKAGLAAAATSGLASLRRTHTLLKGVVEEQPHLPSPRALLLLEQQQHSASPRMGDTESAGTSAVTLPPLSVRASAIESLTSTVASPTAYHARILAAQMSPPPPPFLQQLPPPPPAYLIPPSSFPPSNIPPFFDPSSSSSTPFSASALLPPLPSAATSRSAAATRAAVIASVFPCAIEHLASSTTPRSGAGRDSPMRLVLDTLGEERAVVRETLSEIRGLVAAATAPPPPGATSRSTSAPRGSSRGGGFGSAPESTRPSFRLPANHRAAAFALAIVLRQAVRRRHAAAFSAWRTFSQEAAAADDTRVRGELQQLLDARRGALLAQLRREEEAEDAILQRERDAAELAREELLLQQQQIQAAREELLLQQQEAQAQALALAQAQSRLHLTVSSPQRQGGGGNNIRISSPMRGSIKVAGGGSAFTISHAGGAGGDELSIKTDHHAHTGGGGGPTLTLSQDNGQRGGGASSDESVGGFFATITAGPDAADATTNTDAVRTHRHCMSPGRPIWEPEVGSLATTASSRGRQRAPVDMIGTRARSGSGGGGGSRAGSKSPPAIRRSSSSNMVDSVGTGGGAGSRRGSVGSSGYPRELRPSSASSRPSTTIVARAPLPQGFTVTLSSPSRADVPASTATVVLQPPPPPPSQQSHTYVHLRSSSTGADLAEVHASLSSAATHSARVLATTHAPINPQQQQQQQQNNDPVSAINELLGVGNNGGMRTVRANDAPPPAAAPLSLAATASTGERESGASHSSARPTVPRLHIPSAHSAIATAAPPQQQHQQSWRDGSSGRVLQHPQMTPASFSAPHVSEPALSHESGGASVDPRALAVQAILATREEQVRRMVSAADEQLIRLAVAAAGAFNSIPPPQAPVAAEPLLITDAGVGEEAASTTRRPLSATARSSVAQQLSSKRPPFDSSQQRASSSSSRRSTSRRGSVIQLPPTVWPRGRSPPSFDARDPLASFQAGSGRLVQSFSAADPLGNFKQGWHAVGGGTTIDPLAGFRASGSAASFVKNKQRSEPHPAPVASIVPSASAFVASMRSAWRAAALGGAPAEVHQVPLGRVLQPPTSPSRMGKGVVLVKHLPLQPAAITDALGLW